MSIALATMDDIDLDDSMGKGPQSRIRWHDADEEARDPRSPFTRAQDRNHDRDDMSIRSIRSMSGRSSNVDPATALPIQYRTV